MERRKVRVMVGPVGNVYNRKQTMKWAAYTKHTGWIVMGMGDDRNEALEDLALMMDEGNAGKYMDMYEGGLFREV